MKKSEGNVSNSMPCLCPVAEQYCLNVELEKTTRTLNRVDELLLVSPSNELLLHGKVASFEESQTR